MCCAEPIVNRLSVCRAYPKLHSFSWRLTQKNEVQTIPPTFVGVVTLGFLGFLGLLGFGVNTCSAIVGSVPGGRCEPLEGCPGEWAPLR